MYIRMTTQRNKKTGRTYSTYRLVESYRNQSGQVRQRTLLNLGANFIIAKEMWKILADRIEAICRGQQALFSLDPAIEKEAKRIAKLIMHKYSEAVTSSRPIDVNTELAHAEKDYQSVDINSLSHHNLRKIGCEYVGYHATKQLELPKILTEIGFNPKQVNLALGTIIGRLASPGSELSTHYYLTEQSGLDELLNTDFSGLPLKNLYKISDQLLKNKTAIEQALYKRERDLFNLEEIITLYDITNTYFEGSSLANPKAKYGRSKEKRNDCPLVALGMVLDASGFPKKSDFFPGNIGEPTTVEQMLTQLNAEKSATVVMDAGFASEANINWLKASGYSYIVVSRKHNNSMPNHSEKVLVKEDKHNQVHASLIKNEETDELELYCHSQAKEKKTQAMIDQSSARYEEELHKLKNGLSKKGCMKKYEKVMEKVGRLKEIYKRGAQHYKVSVEADAANQYAISIHWEPCEEKQAKRLGVYCLRTNRQDLDEKTFWKIYTMLTELESAFRSLKSELGMRPIYHQKEERVDGHLFISILAYHLLHTIRYQLKSKGIHESWQTLRRVLDVQCRLTSTLQLKTGKTVQIRKTSSPDANQALI